MRLIVKMQNFALKGVFAKNERGYRLTVKNKRFWSLLILLRSVAYIRRKLLKMTEELSVHTNSESCNIRTFLENMKMSSSFSKILTTGINVFKSNYPIMRNKILLWNINYLWMRLKIIYNSWMICLWLNWFVYDPI